MTQPEQEPIAWMVYTQDGQSVYVTDNPTDIKEGQRALPLYTIPPNHEWVDLTDEQMEALEAQYMSSGQSAHGFLKAVKNALKENNT